MRNEILEIAHHCRVMSDHTIGLTAAGAPGGAAVSAAAR
jgi:hypothetical protein